MQAQNFQARLNHVLLITRNTLPTFMKNELVDTITLQEQAATYTLAEQTPPLCQQGLTTYHTLAHIKMLPMTATEKKLLERTDLTENTSGHSFS